MSHKIDNSDSEFTATVFDNDRGHGKISRAQFRVMPEGLKNIRGSLKDVPYICVALDDIDEYAIIEGAADLRALRDLINSLPEGAFVDPVPAWADGDVVTFDGVNIQTVYTRVGGEWSGVRRHSTDSAPHLIGPYADTKVDHWLAYGSSNYAVLRRGGQPVS